MAKVYVTRGADYPVDEINGLEIVTQNPGDTIYAIVGSYDPRKAILSLTSSTLIECDKPLVNARRMNWSELTAKLNPEVVIGNRIVLRRATKDGLLSGENSVDIGSQVHQTAKVIEIRNV